MLKFPLSVLRICISLPISLCSVLCFLSSLCTCIYPWQWLQWSRWSKTAMYSVVWWLDKTSHGQNLADVGESERYDHYLDTYTHFISYFSWIWHSMSNDLVPWVISSSLFSLFSLSSYIYSCKRCTGGWSRPVGRITFSSFFLYTFLHFR